MMSGVVPISQDCKPVVIRKRVPTAAAKKDENVFNILQYAAKRQDKKVVDVSQLLDSNTKIYNGSQLLETNTKIYNGLQSLETNTKIYNGSQSLETNTKVYNVWQLLENNTKVVNISQYRKPGVIRKKAPTAAARKDEKVVNAARGAAVEIETVKKSTAGTNKAASSGTSLNTRKLDEATENLSHARVTTEMKKALMQARLDKKLTQAQVAQMINEKPQVIQRYESGKAIPNQQTVGKHERALGVKLRGKK